MATLEEAFNEKVRKYRSLGTYIKPLIFSAGGLLAKESAQSYKQIQTLVGPFIAVATRNVARRIMTIGPEGSNVQHAGVPEAGTQLGPFG